MSRFIFIKIMVITLTSFTMCFASEVNEPNKDTGITAQPSTVISTVKARPRMESVTIVDFYMRDGNTVSGRMLSEDKNQVVIEQTEESTIVTRAYGKKEIDMRTYSTRPLLEWKYYIQLAEYFSARTWDFVDDPDDFIEAIRCYEKAKQSLVDSGADQERIQEIDKDIAKIKQDKEVWTSQVETRAKLKKLEYDAEAENRLKKLEKQIVESNIRLNESIKSLDKTVVDLKNNYQQIQTAVTGMNKDFVQQINTLQAQINDSRAAIDDLSYRLFLSNFRPAPAPH